MDTSEPNVIVIVGPTGSGKTDLGVAVAKQLGGAVVSADSRQVYSGLAVGTAKPKVKSQKSKVKTAHDVLVPDVVDGVEHYLLNIREPDAELTLADWQTGALKVIDHLVAAERTPLLVGGTMLYVDSIVKNYSIPEVEPDAALRAQLEQLPNEELLERLRSSDPAALDFIEPRNTRRLIRALEVIEKTGKLFSEQRRARPSPYSFKLVGLFPGWDVLEQRLRERAAAMLREGLLGEVKLLRERYGSDLPLLSTINYREVGVLLDGDATEVETIAAMARANLRYARRQMSWWRERDEVRWFSDADDALLHLSK